MDRRYSHLRFVVTSVCVLGDSFCYFVRFVTYFTFSDEFVWVESCFTIVQLTIMDIIKIHLPNQNWLLVTIGWLGTYVTNQKQNCFVEFSKLLYWIATCDDYDISCIRVITNKSIVTYRNYTVENMPVIISLIEQENFNRHIKKL